MVVSMGAWIAQSESCEAAHDRHAGSRRRRSSLNTTSGDKYIIPLRFLLEQNMVLSMFLPFL
jgi:hypothetical protein